MTEETLLPCPFCGTRDVKLIEVSPPYTDRWRVAHDHEKTGFYCYVSGPVRKGQAEAMAAWNTRTTADLQARLDAAQARNAELVEALQAAAAAFSMINADRYFRSAQTRARVEVDRINAALARTQGETP